MSAVPASRRVFDNRDPDRLGFALLIGVAVHAIALFGIGFTALPKSRAPASMAVTLAFDDAGKTPEQADFLAQINQLGSGDGREAAELSRDRDADFSAERINPTEPVGAAIPPDGGEAHRSPPVAADAAQPATAPLPSQETGQSAPVAAAFSPPAAEVASLKAKLDHLQRDYSRAPRVLRVTSVTTKAAAEAPYLDYWETLVEQVGNQHYPEEARRQRVFGSLRLAVRLRPDGSVEQVEVLASSGHRVLDLAAIRTIRLAAPFAPFPPELAHWDRLEIIRTWQFVPGDRLQTAAPPP